MTPKQRQLRIRQIQDSMKSLVGDVRFTDFIEAIEEQKEAALEDALSDRVVSNKRRLMAALGEVRAYKNFLSLYENTKALVEADEPQTEEQG